MKKHYSLTKINPFFHCAAVALILFTSCCTQKQDGQVYRDWATSFSQLGIYPVFPPREDVMVGDIYLLPMHPLNSYVIGHLGGLGSTGVHIGYCDWAGTNGAASMAASFEDYYSNRLTFPDGSVGGPIASPTNSISTSNNVSQAPPKKQPVKNDGGTMSTNSPGGAAANVSAEEIRQSRGTNESTVSPISASPQSTNQTFGTNSVFNASSKNNGGKAPSTETNQAAPSIIQDIPVLPKSLPDSRTTVFAPLAPVRLKEVAFPEFAFTKISEASFAAAIPMEGVLINAGLDLSKVSQVSVKIPVAESYGMPVGRLLRDFFHNDIWCVPDVTAASIENATTNSTTIATTNTTTITTLNTNAAVATDATNVTTSTTTNPNSTTTMTVTTTSTTDGKTITSVTTTKTTMTRTNMNMMATTNVWYLRADPSARVVNVLTRPAGEMARAMLTETLKTAISNTYPASENPVTHERLMREVEKDKDYLYLALITEVFYTRSIDISVSGTSAHAFGASAGPVSTAQVATWMGLNKGSTNSSTISTNSQSNGSTNSTKVSEQVISTSGSAENSDPFAVADKLRNLSLGYTNGIGGSMRILGVSAHSVAMRRTFEHPIAVGVRGVILKISATAVPLPSYVQPFDQSQQDAPPEWGYKIELLKP